MASPSSSIRLPTLDKYEVVAELGHGGMATVYRARDVRLDRAVAVKVLHPHLRQSSEMGHRFHAEARAVAKLKHRNIVEVYDVSGPEEYEQYLVVELVEGATLRTTLDKSGLWPPEVAAALGLELLCALSHAHAQGVIHRDIKPENVMIGVSSLDQKGQGATEVKLTDFGIAKLLDQKGVTSTGQVLGSPAHMAPEQIEGNEVDARADVFGMGVLLYECMVGHLPFHGSNPAQVLRRVLEGEYARADNEVQTIGRVWGGILDKALAQNREDRFESADVMRIAISDELVRLGFAPDASLLTEFLVDPDTFRELHVQRLSKKLVELGSASRARRATLAAANDYNRALAFRPDDVELCKMAASVSRPAGGAVRRPFVAAGGGALLLFAGLAFVRARDQHGAVTVQPPPSTLPAMLMTTDAVTLPRAVATGSTTLPKAQVPLLPKTAATRAKLARSVHITSVRPIEGVLVTVDSDAPRAVSVGMLLSVDAEAHELQFGCKGELCIRQTKAIPAGEQAVDIAVQLELKPSTLFIEGDASHKYQIAEYPNLGVLRAAVPISIPLHRNDEAITVTELETSQTRTVLMRAGGEKRASFAP
jgi:eukaryotic-like serine/threonine-protein kinase